MLVARTVTGALSLAMLTLACLPRNAAPQSLLAPDYTPVHRVRLEKSFMVPMRDRTKLSTDLYFPEAAPGKLPAILIRTPYDKASPRLYEFRSPRSIAHYFASHGYVVAVQDVRGKFESQGVFTIAANEGRDGADTVEWLSAQPWSNGKVGSYGCSYLGESQLEMARLRPANLAAMIPQAAGGSARYFGLINGGAYEIGAAAAWFHKHGAKYAPKLDASLPREVFVATAEAFDLWPDIRAPNLTEMWRALPTLDMLDRSGAAPSDWRELLTHTPSDSWWDQFGFVKAQDLFDAPALHVSSWYDPSVGDTLKLFNQLRENAISARGRDNQFVVISPTGHCASEAASERTVVGARELGDARLRYHEIYLQWFDYWLKGVRNDVTRMPKVQIYVMGRNAWRGENEWPLARTVWTKYYLHSGGRANSRLGDGTLSTTAPGEQPADAFIYDPRTPVPSLGGAICCTNGSDTEPGAFDQSEIELRNDVLVYTSPPLQRGIEVTGPVKAVLYVASSAADTDFTAKLVDVGPEGSAYNVQEGILRARFRNGYASTSRMVAGHFYEISIDLQATSNYFAPGHRLRLEVSSSNFPRFDRNMNTGGNNVDEATPVAARNIVHHSGIHASYLLLPTIPPDSGGRPVPTRPH